MTLSLWIAIFALGIVALVKASQVFTDATEKIGKSLRISQFLTGMIVLAVATSLPELTTGIFASLKGYSSVVTANVLGSNIANILLILALVAIFSRSIVLHKDGALSQVPILLASTFLLIVVIYDGSVTWPEGIVMLLAYLIYAASNYEVYKNGILENIREEFESTALHGKVILSFVLSLVVVLVSAHFTIEAVIHVSSELNILPSLLGGTIVALGTSLPELSTTFAAARKKNFDLAIGNIIGSNIFNATLVMAIPAFISKLVVTNDVLTIALPFLLIATILLIFLALQRKIAIYDGAFMCLLYIIFFIQFLNPSL